MINTIILMANGDGGSIINIVIMVAMFAVMYFFFIRPQNQKQKEQNTFESGIKIGDKIVTQSGMFGKISKIDDDSLLLETESGSRIRILKSAISAEWSKKYNIEKSS
jgi:preprotein translocase subunit YajC